MSIASYITLQASVGHLLSLLKKPQLKVPQKLKNSVNFLLREDDDTLTAVDIRSKVPVNMLNIMVKGFEGVGGKIKRFVMITPYPPSPQERKAFEEAFSSVFAQAEWLSVNDFAKSLGLNADYDLTSPAVIERLKAASVSEAVFSDQAPEPQATVESVEAESAPEAGGKAAQRHKAKPKAGSGPTRAEQVNALLDSFDKGEKEVPHAYVNLTRKMPYQTLRALKDSAQQPEDFFRIGQSSRDAIIVLSDIVNFSLLVRTAYAEDLNEAMFRYYRGAKALIHENGGILDKFNGDSVLAVFNYPMKNDQCCTLAVRYAAGLVQLGKDILSNLTAAIDEKIPTGTRVGVSMGEIWTLNIGTDEIDVTFVGDKINLAKRLETNCAVNGVLLSNVFYTTLARTDQTFHATLKAEKQDLPEDKVKGQTTDIISWQILPKVLSGLI